MKPTTHTALLLILLLLSACERPPQPADPALLYELERTLAPNTTDTVTDGELVTGLYFVVEQGFGYPRGSWMMPLYVDPNPIVTAGNFTEVRMDQGLDDRPELRFQLDSIGAARWQVATRKVAGLAVAIVVNDSVVSAPVVMEEIANGSASWVPGAGGAMRPEDYLKLLKQEQKRVAPVR